MCCTQRSKTTAEQEKIITLYEKYKKLMYQVSFKILKNEFDAEDTVQQAFVSIIEHFDMVGDLDSPRTKALLLIITERKALDLLRAKKTIVNIDEVEIGIDIPLPGDNGLSDALARIPARYRELLLLHFDNGYTTTEIAKLLHMSTGAVQKTIWRAKQALKEKLSEQEVAI